MSRELSLQEKKSTSLLSSPLLTLSLRSTYNNIIILMTQFDQGGRGVMFWQRWPKNWLVAPVGTDICQERHRPIIRMVESSIPALSVAVTARKILIREADFL